MATSTAQKYEEKKGKEKYDKEYWMSYTKEKFEESRNWRGSNVELQWFVNYMYYKGNQNLKYDRTTGTFTKDVRNPLTFYINHTYMVCRAIRNAVMKTNPSWDVDALPYGELDNDTSRILGEYLAFQYDRLNLEEKINKGLLFGLLYGLGIFQYGYDDKLDDGEGTSWSQIGNQRVANIYPWDRTSASFSLPVQIQENGIHAMLQVNNKVYVVAGTAGNVYVTDGTSYQKIGRIPWSQDRNISNSIRVFPNAITTNVNNNLIVGVSSGAGTQDQLGIYEIALSEGYPICLKNTPEGYTLGGDLQIGFLTTSNQGQTYVGYGVNGTYDVDYTRFNAYVGYKAVIESPLYSVGTSTNKKTFQHGEFILAKPLTYHQKIRISYRKDTESDYVLIGTYSFSDLGSKRSHLFTPHIADAENVQIKIELGQNEYTSPNPTNWDLELMSISLW